MNTIEAVQIIENMLGLEQALLKQFESKKVRENFVKELKNEIKAMCAVVSLFRSGTIIEDPKGVSFALKNMIKQNFKYIRKASETMDFSGFGIEDYSPDELYKKERFINKLSTEVKAIEFALSCIED